MNEVIKISKELSEKLHSNPIVEEFLRYKAIYEQDEELNKLRYEMARQKALDNMEEYNKLKDKFDNHPITVNYTYLKEEVVNLLREISEVIKI